LKALATEEKTALVKEPSIPRFSKNNCDLSVDPLKDFYAYSAGGWIKRNPVPKNKTDWNSFDELYEWNLSALKKILEDSKDGRSQDGSSERLVGDFYSSAMNTSRIQSAGFDPIRQILDHAHIAEKGESLALTIAKLHKSKVNALFFSYSMADKKNSSTYAFYLHQGGLSLPDREYYLSDSFKEIRDAYLEHISRVFTLLGHEESKSLAEIVLEFEIELAKICRPRAELRDEEKNLWCSATG
jgi:putative endopeptidase